MKNFDWSRCICFFHERCMRTMYVHLWSHYMDSSAHVCLCYDIVEWTAYFLCAPIVATLGARIKSFPSFSLRTTKLNRYALNYSYTLWISNVYVLFISCETNCCFSLILLSQSPAMPDMTFFAMSVETLFILDRLRSLWIHWSNLTQATRWSSLTRRSGPPSPVLCGWSL